LRTWHTDCLKQHVRQGPSLKAASPTEAVYSFLLYGLLIIHSAKHITDFLLKLNIIIHTFKLEF